MSELLRCRFGDHDVPGLVCGHPLPCPWHTVIVDKGNITIPPDLLLRVKDQRRLKDVAKAVAR